MPHFNEMQKEFEVVEKHYETIENNMKEFISEMLFENASAHVSRVSDYHRWFDDKKRNVLSGYFCIFLKRSDNIPFITFMNKDIKTSAKQKDEFDELRFAKYIREVLVDEYKKFGKKPDITLNVKTNLNRKGVKIKIDFQISYDN